MVYVKRVELTNFKSFGGTTSVPLLPGCTVISGPNGSGKSNILDALLFCLGLSSSKGMRAERLPDLVNNAQKHQGRSPLEASVTVTFDISDVSPRGAEAQREEGEEVAQENPTLDVSPRGAEAQREEGEEVAQENPTLDVSRRGAEARREEEEEEENPKSTVHSPKSSDWSVTRRLRVSQQGGYTSNYYINGVPCTLTELHEDLQRLRIYPQGYNVVLQGDVTSIISMNGRERREIIDELAGVATYDRRIVQARSTLDEVKDREDSCRIIQNELTVQSERLYQDQVKAQKYQQLRTEFLEKQSWEAVLSWRSLQLQQEKLLLQVEEGDRNFRDFTSQLTIINTQIDEKNIELEQRNLRVKALGEEELLAVQSHLATQEAERKQLQRQHKELEAFIQESTKRLNQIYQEIQQYQLSLEEAIEKHNVETLNAASLQIERNHAVINLESSRQAAAEVASASEAWVQQQTELNRNIESLLHILEPQRTEQAQLQERNTQLQLLISEQSQLIATLQPELTQKQVEFAQVETEFNAASLPIQNLAENLTATEQELQIQQDTQKRLLQEQREKQRQLDKLEAQTQAQQEIQGTQASKIILQSEMPGLCGLVVQLGKVEPKYQLALETAAGGRLGYIVVEDDSVASAGIELLKQKKAGRATFLPLNKIKVPKFTQDAT
ncbi:AAA family ATPase, partial [Dolichospermum circinale CS-1225]|uniref:ATP-binding protein n=1 Tax=Dolichospermum circinale TaxID=109265 RepID=UPI0023307BEC